MANVKERLQVYKCSVCGNTAICMGCGKHNLIGIKWILKLYLK